MSPLLAQAAPAPDLTRPITVIAICAAVIVATVLIQVVGARRRGRPATPDELRAWQEDGGRVLDQWIAGVEAELHTLRTAPFPDTVTPTEDPLGMAEAVADCPDGQVAERIAELQDAARAMLATARAGDPNRPEVAAAEARFVQAKERAGAQLRDASGPASPQ